jgi:nucleotide-binding universal stress UspA family protein
MRVLIGVDDSTYSRTALEFVRKVSWPADTTVMVVSSVTPPTIGYMTDYSPAENLALETSIAELTKSSRELVTRSEKLLRAPNLRTESHVLEGDPRETLIEYAKANQVDLIVVGSHGRTGFQKLLLGSVASHLVTHAPCSVLVVK